MMTDKSALVIVAILFVSSCGAGSRDREPAFAAPAVTSAAPSRASSDDFAFARGADTPKDSKPSQVGMASWYGDKFSGKKTASGEPFDPTKMTAAHRKLPFGTWVEVRRRDTGATVRVRITDRGPWKGKNRIIDVSKAAAEQLGLIESGVAPVELRVVRGP